MRIVNDNMFVFVLYPSFFISGVLIQQQPQKILLHCVAVLGFLVERKCSYTFCKTNLKYTDLRNKFMETYSNL